MSTLVVVRHGQASFFEDHYDRLSAIGRRQSRLLGEYWAERGITFDEVYTGPRERQIDTAMEVGEAFRGAGLAWPEPVVLPELDEYQAEAVLKQALPGLLEEHAESARCMPRSRRPSDATRSSRSLFSGVSMRSVDRTVAAASSTSRALSLGLLSASASTADWRASPRVVAPVAAPWRSPRAGRWGSPWSAAAAAFARAHAEAGLDGSQWQLDQVFYFRAHASLSVHSTAFRISSNPSCGRTANRGTVPLHGF